MPKPTRMIEILKGWIGGDESSRKFNDMFCNPDDPGVQAENDALDAKIAENKKHLKHREDDDA